MITIMNLLYVNLFLYVLGTPPTPERPVVLNVTSNAVAFKWPKYECGGGHDVQFFNIRVGYYIYFFSSLTYRYIYSIDARLSSYTVTGLSSSTTYYLSIRAVGKDNVLSSYSSSSSFLTLPPGNVYLKQSYGFT